MTILGKNTKKTESGGSESTPEIAVDKKVTEEKPEKGHKKESKGADGSDAKKTANPNHQNSTEDSAKDEIEKGENNNDASNGTGETADTAGHDSVSDIKAEVAAERDKYLRLAAEYDNFRKRSTKELQTVYSNARADTLLKLLPVYDNLERALKMECSDEPFYKGVEMTMTQLTEILENMDVKKIDAIGKAFDPSIHNAIVTIENPELGEKVVADEIQKGFMLGDKVIRFSSVVVAN